MPLAAASCSILRVEAKRPSPMDLRSPTSRLRSPIARLGRTETVRLIHINRPPLHTFDVRRGRNRREIAVPDSSLRLHRPKSVTSLGPSIVNDIRLCSRRASQTMSKSDPPAKILCPDLAAQFVSRRHQFWHYGPRKDKICVRRRIGAARRMSADLAQGLFTGGGRSAGPGGSVGGVKSGGGPLSDWRKATR